MRLRLLLSALVLIGVTDLRAARAQGEAGADEIRRLIDAGSYGPAVVAAREAAARVDRVASPSTAAHALTLLVEALMQAGARATPECLTAAAEAVRLTEREGASQGEQATALYWLGAVRLTRKETALARQAAERAHEMRRRERGEEDPETARSLELLAAILDAEGHLPEARSAYERVLAVYEAKLGAGHRDTAAALNQLAGVLRRQRDYASAQALAERGLAIRRAVLPPMHPDVAESLNTLGNVLLNKGESGSALELFEEALQIRERILGAEHPDVGQMANNIGGVRFARGDVSGARPLFEQALRVREKALGPDHPDVAPNVNSLAAILQTLGDFSGARTLYERAIRIRERGADQAALATSLNNLATLLQKTGDFGEAEPLYKRALAIREAQRDPLVPQSLQNLGLLYLEERRLQEAASLLERALDIRERVEPQVPRDLAVSLSSLASLRRAEGNRSEARRLETRALEIRSAALGADHLELAGSYLMLGTLSLEEGDTDGARTALQRALEIRERALGAEHPQVAAPLVGLAAAFDRAGEGERALEAALRAEEIGRHHLAVTARSLPERQALRYAATRASGLDWALHLAARDSSPASAERAWDALARSRALVLDEMAARQRSLANPEATDMAPRLQAWQSARERYANLVLRGPGNDLVSRYRALVDEARRDSEAAERVLAERSAAFRADRERARLGLAEIRAALPADAALLAYARFRDPAAKAGGDADQYLAFVAASRSGPPQLVRLGSAASIDALVGRWRAGVSSGLAEAELNRIGALLRRRVWDPVAPLLAARPLVLVVPDGALHLLSFGALPAADGRYLVEAGPNVHVLSAERDLARPAVARHEGTALAIGGVAFDAGAAPSARPPGVEAGGSCGDLSGVRFAELPGTRAEVSDLLGLWRRAGRGEMVALDGERATEAAFRHAVAGRSLLHLATHGFFLGGRCAAAAANTRGIGGVSALPDPEPRGLESPLVLSGLALAGANRRGTLAEADGVLTASEIAALDLSSVDWAVLSACDTGVGEIAASEGVLGLRRAFQVAGARSIVMSLWSVDDASTREWMRLFYDALLVRRQATAEAVRQASLLALRARRARGEPASPFYWGAFIAAGDWR